VPAAGVRRPTGTSLTSGTGAVISQEALHALAARLTGIDGIVGVLLGGSRARGDHTPESDVDLGLYYRPPLDVAALGELAGEIAGPGAAVTEPGAWGPWVDGGGWLTVSGTAVDWLYRDLDRVHAAWADARAGRYAFHAQVGHPLGVPDFAYPGEVALGVVLADPTEELRELRQQTQAYPPRLADALVEGLWEASFLIDNARKAVTRRDTTYIAGCLFRVVGLCAHALHGRAGRWLINEKGAVASAGRLEVAPEGFAAQAHGVLAHVGTSPGELTAALDAAAALVARARTACGRPS
jgi:hypothetical protein